jgi:hypothetical protein
MYETSCEGSPRYIDKKVSLREEEQAVEQPLPSFWDEKDQCEEWSTIEMVMFLEALRIPL